MATIINMTGFEYGLSAFSTNGAGLVNSITGSPSISTTQKHSGSYAMRTNTSAATAYIQWTVSTQRIVTRFWIYFTTKPDATYSYICAPCHLTGNAYPAFFYVPATNKFSVGFNGVSYNQESSMTVNTGQWYCIDLDCDISINQHTIDWKVDGIAQTQAVCSTGGTAYTGTAYRLGTITAATGDIYFDDVIYSYTAGDYPIPLDGVEGRRPDSDGTHNAGTNVIEDGDGNDIGAVTAYDHLDEDPWSSTAGGADVIKQVATGTSNYAEINFQDATNTTILGVMAYLQYSSSGTSTNQGAIQIWSNTTTTDLWGNPTTRADMSESSSFYKRALVSPDGGSWTQAKVNALKARMGYSNDINPVPYWQAVMLEVGYQSAVNINLAKAVLTATGRAITIDKGAVSVALAKAILTATGQTITVSAPPPAININLSRAILTAIGQAFTIQKGPVSIALTKAVLTATGRPITVDAPVTISLARAILTATGQTITVDAPAAGINISLAAAQLTAAGRSITVVPGAVSKALNTAQLVANGRPITIQTGPVSIQLDEAQLIAHGEDITVLTGPVSIALTRATITATGQTITISAPGSGINIVLNAASLVANGRQLTIVPGAVAKALNTAILTALGRTLTVDKGPVSIALGKGTLTAIGRSISIIPGAVTTALNRAILTALGRTITVLSPTGTVVLLGRAILTAIGQRIRVIQDLKPTPADRIYYIVQETRTIEPDEDRVFEILSEIRNIILDKDRCLEAMMAAENEFAKDPAATLDYTVNWTDWLGSDTIQASSWAVPTGVTKVSDNHSNTLATIWVSGGTPGSIYPCVNTITTVGGRTDQRTIMLFIVEK